ncbi:MAG: NAD(P)-binding domain-containing protein, partial [Desulfuromonadales bacterium]|nr:NAD(P)-binding domain-containing protein [Desulfuromonadales bacterium]
MQIGVIGAGSWGTTLADLLADKGFKVTLWAYEADLVERLQETRENDLYLPGFTLAENLDFTNTLADAVTGKQLVLFVPPSQILRSLLQKVVNAFSNDAIIVSASKGIENESLLPMSEIFAELLPPTLQERTAYLSGPSFAKEVAQ